MAIERKYPPVETRERIMKWCAIQERAHSDVRRKLSSWGVYGDESEVIIGELISGNFLNEERFARAFARGKFRIKHWGWAKIQNELRRKGVSSFCIAKAAAEIDADESKETIFNLIKKKASFSRETDRNKLRQKLQRYGYSKGYSFGLVNQAIEDALKES